MFTTCEILKLNISPVRRLVLRWVSIQIAMRSQGMVGLLYVFGTSLLSYTFHAGRVETPQSLYLDDQVCSVLRIEGINRMDFGSNPAVLITSTLSPQIRKYDKLLHSDLSTSIHDPLQWFEPKGTPRIPPLD
jgi:hypothetical protein